MKKKYRTRRLQHFRGERAKKGKVVLVVDFKHKGNKYIGWMSIPNTGTDKREKAYAEEVYSRLIRTNGLFGLRIKNFFRKLMLKP